jgi:hypothetical protein
MIGRERRRSTPSKPGVPRRTQQTQGSPLSQPQAAETTQGLPVQARVSTKGARGV